MKLELSTQIRWHAWAGEQITADSTTLRICVVNDTHWFETEKKEEFLNEEYVKELQQDERLYELPSTWGDRINISNLAYCETLFVEMLPDDHAWKLDPNHVRRVTHSRELYRLNAETDGEFPVRMSELH
jgi:hypothetical protein